jgi:hypothetical protein
MRPQGACKPVTCKCFVPHFNPSQTDPDPNLRSHPPSPSVLLLLRVFVCVCVCTFVLAQEADQVTLMNWLDNYKEAMDKAPAPADDKKFAIDDYFELLVELVRKERKRPHYFNDAEKVLAQHARAHAPCLRETVWLGRLGLRPGVGFRVGRMWGPGFWGSRSRCFALGVLGCSGQC